MSPLFTVIVPSFDRPEQLAHCLEALAALTHPSYEVIVVDDGSSAPLGTVADAFAERLDLRLIQQDNQGPGPARNRGAEEARGTYLAFTDDDCRPRPDWLQALEQVLEKEPRALIGGRTVNGIASDPYAGASQDLSIFLYDYRAAYGEGGAAMDFFPTLNVACRREDFLSVGGFDPAFYLTAEDRNLGMRWKASGRPLRQAPNAVVEHFHHLTFSKFLKQHANYGRGARFIREYTVKRDGQSVRFEGLRFYRRLLLHPFVRKDRQALRKSVLLGLSQAAMVYGFAAETTDRMLGRKKTSAGTMNGAD